MSQYRIRALGRDGRPWYLIADRSWVNDPALAQRFATPAEAHNVGNTLPVGNWVCEPVE